MLWSGAYYGVASRFAANIAWDGAYHGVARITTRRITVYGTGYARSAGFAREAGIARGTGFARGAGFAGLFTVYLPYFCCPGEWYTYHHCAVLENGIPTISLLSWRLLFDHRVWTG